MVKRFDYRGYGVEAKKKIKALRGEYKRWDNNLLRENSIGRLEKKLADVKAGEYDFICSECKRVLVEDEIPLDRRRKLCHLCGFDKDVQEAKAKIDTLVGAKVVEVVWNPDCLTPDNSIIKKIRFKTNEGRNIVLDNPPKRYRL